MKDSKVKALSWRVGFCKSLDSQPEEFYPATVPGAVQLDYAKAKNWQAYYYDNNWYDYLWMEDVYWLYQTIIPDMSNNLPQKRVFLVSKGIDYKFQVRLNKKVIYKQEGMFQPFELDLTDKTKKGDCLEIIIFPIPKSFATPADIYPVKENCKSEVPYSKLTFFSMQGRDQANQSCKPAVSYGWDFHPRLVPSGIWDDIYLDFRESCHIKSADISYTLNDDLNFAEVTAKVKLSQTLNGKLRWIVIDESGNTVIFVESPIGKRECLLRTSLENPQLWWPNGQGDQILYSSKIQLLNDNDIVIQESQSRIGFRKVRLVMNENTWEQPREYPKTRSVPPITLEINNREIFCKGANWLPPSIFPGTLTKNNYDSLLKLAKNANMNILRIWGGGGLGKDSFFELCDEYGIMCWQEFPLACARYEATESYLKILDQESRAIIKRIRHHPSVVMWCGGNELFNAWSQMTDQDLALRLLNRNCYDLDPQTPFLPTSPVMGMGHGPYLFEGPDGRGLMESIANAECTAYTEFSCGGPSPFEVFKKIIPEKNLAWPKPETAWETHHGFNAFLAGGSQTWMQTDFIQDFFGPVESLEQLVEYGEFLQAEALRFVFEEARRQKKHCSMAISWCFNEVWPVAAGTSLVAWPDNAKPAYNLVSSACRPALASAKICKLNWHGGELFEAELWILNDSPQKLDAGNLQASLKIGKHTYNLLNWEFAELPANSNLRGPTVRFTLPELDIQNFMCLGLSVAGNPDMDSEYSILLKPQPCQSENKLRILNL